MVLQQRQRQPISQDRDWFLEDSMGNDSAFVRFASVCSCVSGITTFLMWYLSRLIPATPHFEQTLQLANNPAYMLRWWINFAHIFFALAAYCGAALVLRHCSLGWALWSALQFGIWGLVELIGVSVAIWSVNRGWRTEYGIADPHRRELLRTFLEGWPGVWNGLFFLLLIAFLLGSLSLGLLAIKGRGLERLTGILLLLSIPLSLLIILGEYWNVNLASRLENIIYPVLQPASRIVMGVWLWKEVQVDAGPVANVCCEISVIARNDATAPESGESSHSGQLCCLNA